MVSESSPVRHNLCVKASLMPRQEHDVDDVLFLAASHTEIHINCKPVIN